MTALHSAFAPRIKLRCTPTPRFEIGDHVLVHGQAGMVIGVRYGAPAYDVRVNGKCLRNLLPQTIRLAAERSSLPSPRRRTAA